MRASVAVLVFGIFGSVLLVVAGAVQILDGALPGGIRALWAVIAGIGAVWIVFSIRQLIQLRSRR